MNKHISEHEIVVDSLTEALFSLLLKKPFSKISITELIKLAGVARSTYYNNFSSKEEIIFTFFRSIFLEFQNKYPITCLDQRYSEEHFSHVLEFVLHYSDKVKILAKAGLAPYYLTCLNNYLLSIYSNPKMSPKDSLKIYFLAGAEYNLIFNWYLTECNNN